MSSSAEKKTNVIYIGSTRRRKIEKATISLSVHAGKPISAAKITQEVLDMYLESYIKDFIENTPPDDD
ncbi:hypothetical protein B4U61_024085 [Klebsiella pneumoniae]|uniref:hypothetical protein n=1 Tax=Klebsiella pneumoniae TaxID=573 RepID=UPI000B02DBCA|nr:hypothetical protein [Klebsiella pneumoniae]MBD7808249.1 hypothetical protein [Klebsiella pneumoniae]MCD1274733.1 hypothetical protein [Klebsiella pneumoniae]HBQ7904400.1 hypothetical protein [Klebsiella pneumoniae]HBU7638018.1 hypothetical protein [Klebsiella pneumoniae]HBW3581345.1 hypothetical protein [Klebsiella pneumoniae]